MAIVTVPEGAEIGVQIRHVWMGSHQALRNMPEDISYAPAVVVYAPTEKSIYDPESKTKLFYPLNPYYTEQMRDRLRWICQERAKPKTAGERYMAQKNAKGLMFEFDEPTDGIFVADLSASPKGVGVNGAIGSIAFKSRGLDGVVFVAFAREEFETFARVLDQALAAFRGPEASA